MGNKSRTFGLALLKSDGAAAFSHQVPSAWDAGSAPHLRLVGSQWTGTAGDKAVMGVLAGGTLT